MRDRGGRSLASRGRGLVTLLLLAAGAALSQEIPIAQVGGLEPRVAAAIEEARAAVSEGDAESWGRYGMILDAHRLPTQAAVAYRQAARLAPSEFRWVYYLATLLEYTDPAEAATFYARAVEIDPDYAPAQIRYAQTLEALDRDGEAEAAYRRAGSLDPTDPLAPLGQGRIALSQNRVDESVRLLERAYELDPSVRPVVASLARAYARAGRADRARRLAEEARQLPRGLPHRDPRRAAVQDLAVDTESYLHRSKTYADRGNLERARRELETLLRLEPDLAAAWFAAAGVYDRSGLPEQALSAVQRALELDPELAGAGAVQASALFKLQRLDEAEEAARRVLASEPSNEHMLVLRSMIAASRNDVGTFVDNLDRAYQVRSRGSAMAPVMAQLYADLAGALASAGRFQEATGRMERAVEVAQEAGVPARLLAEYRATLADLRRQSRR